MIPEIGKKYNINYFPWPSFVKTQAANAYKGIGIYSGDSRIEVEGFNEIIYWFTNLKDGKCGWFSSDDIVSECKDEV
jgi:hypothetical protein